MVYWSIWITRNDLIFLNKKAHPIAALYIFKCAMGINLKNPKEKRVNQPPVFYRMQQYSFCDGSSQGNPDPSGLGGFIIL